jgi:hypothetical protein
MSIILSKPEVITPPALARRWAVSVEKILTLILRGEFPNAFNSALEIGAGKRPRWKIPLADVQAFERRRAAVPPALKSKRERRQAAEDDRTKFFAET